MKVLGVKKETLDTVGAVSPQKPQSRWLSGVANALGADIGVGITGIAGPGGGTEDKPTGLVYISVWYDGKFFTRKMQFLARPRPCAHAGRLLRRLISSAATFSEQIYIELYVILSFPLKRLWKANKISVKKSPVIVLNCWTFLFM